MAPHHFSRPVKTPVEGRRKALFIAIQYEQRRLSDYEPLEYPHDDARQLRDFCIQNYGYTEDDVTLMLDDGDESRRHLWPTRKNILEQIKLFVKGAKAGDHFFFYFSGHGRQRTNYNHSEEDGLDEAILGCNGKEIIDNKLRKYLVNKLPKGSQLFALWDSCHSETILDLEHCHCNAIYPPVFAPIRRNTDSSLFSVVKSIKSLVKRSDSFQVDQPIGEPSSTGVSRIDHGKERPHTIFQGRPLLIKTDVMPTSWAPIFGPNFKIRRCLSPVSWFPCTGNCKMPIKRNKAHVISLSACKDSQEAYDDSSKGQTMTRIFLDVLKDDPHPSLIALMTRLRKRIDVISRRRLEQSPTEVDPRRRQDEVVYKSKDIDSGTSVSQVTLSGGNGGKKRMSDSVDTSMYQEPQYASHYRLDLDELFYP